MTTPQNQIINKLETLYSLACAQDNLALCLKIIEMEAKILGLFNNSQRATADLKGVNDNALLDLLETLKEEQEEPPAPLDESPLVQDRLVAPPIDGDKEEQPDDVDKVPIPGSSLETNMVVRGKLIAAGSNPTDNQKYSADDDVQAVEPSG